MGSDFSALDAELDTLETGPSVDALLLAHTYAGSSLQLPQVDAVLNQIDADGTLLRTRSSFPPEMPRRERSSQSRPPGPASEEIVLPDPVPRELQRREPGSGEMPLHAPSSRSGSFSLDQPQVKTPQVKSSAKHSGRDDTLEPFDDELIEAEEDLIEFTAAAPSVADEGGSRRMGSLFDPKAQPHASAQEEADAAFEELFSGATSQSNMPARHSSQEPEVYSDDTETFDTSTLGFIENDTRSPDVSMDEELDSAEFEIVVDSDVSKGNTPPARNPSDGPEKRPSFLGRLFGRKDE